MMMPWTWLRLREEAAAEKRYQEWREDFERCGEIEAENARIRRLTAQEDEKRRRVAEKRARVEAIATPIVAHLAACPTVATPAMIAEEALAQAKALVAAVDEGYR